MKTLNREQKTKVGYIIIGVCLVAFGGIITSALALKEASYDPQTLCQDEIPAHTIIVLDKTDAFSANQQRFIWTYINREKDKLRAFEKLSIFKLTDNTSVNPEPIFSKCNPGRGKNANSLYQNPRKIQIRFDSFFSKPLKENMKNLLSDNTGSQSPIFEMIKELSFRDDFSDDVQHRTLIIISDMMHHTSEYSHYRNSTRYKCFSRKTYAYEVATNLNSVNVKIIYLLRDKLRNTQGEDHMLFWGKYFQDMGATVSMVRNVR